MGIDTGMLKKQAFNIKCLFFQSVKELGEIRRNGANTNTPQGECEGDKVPPQIR